MTDKEMIYNYLDKHYTVIVDDRLPVYRVCDKQTNSSQRIEHFFKTFLSIFSDYDTEDGKSYDIMLKWYGEKLGGVEKVNKCRSDFNLLSKERFSHLTTYKAVTGLRYDRRVTSN